MNASGTSTNAPRPRPGTSAEEARATAGKRSMASIIIAMPGKLKTFKLKTPPAKFYKNEGFLDDPIDDSPQLPDHTAQKSDDIRQKKSDTSVKPNDTSQKSGDTSQKSGDTSQKSGDTPRRPGDTPRNPGASSSDMDDISLSSHTSA